jgi:general secretion pathway protein C
MPELRRSAALASEIVAFSALGASLAWLMWSVIEPVGPLASGPVSSPAAGNPETLQVRLAQLPYVSMNGSSSAGPTQVASGFVLHATRAGFDGGGTAILSISGAPQTSFAAGEEIAAGARLALVAADHVEIETGGQRLRVEFSGAERSASVARAPTTELRPASGTQLVNSLPLQAVNRPGGRAAVAVMPQADLSLLGASGLQPGDILLKVDGVDVSTANLANYAAQLQSGRTFEVVFERNGQISSTRIGKPAP